MKVCIYCGKDENIVSFGSREHVIPELLGSFNNNLTLIGLVCNHCNSSVFNPLETIFKEDTHEGIHCQMWNYLNSSEIRVRNGNLKLSVDLGLEEELFNQTFPFLTIRDNKPLILFVPQIRIGGYGKDGYIILLIDKVKKLPRDGKKFLKIKNILRNAKSNDVSIFTHGEEDPERRDFKEAVSLVKELGIDYKPGTEKSLPFVGDGSDQKRATVSADLTIDSKSARVIAKIAFNYFAYCAKSSEKTEILYHPNFSQIKSYILGQIELPINKIIVEKPTTNPILFEEKSQKIRLLGHIVTFENENGYLIARVSFIGQFVYKVLLGKMPDEINKPGFGNGHAFDPFRKEIYGLTQHPERRGPGKKGNFNLIQ